jgi:hypothetical protein
MSFNLPLTSDQYNLLRSGSSAGDYLMTLCTNPVLLHGTVDSDLSELQTWAMFAYTLISGDYTDCRAGMTLLMGTEDDITQATFQGRARLAPSTGAIYTNESSQDFSPGAFFWIVNSFTINYKLSRPDNNAVELVDYNTPYAGPEPMVLGLRTAYVDYADTDTGVLRVAFDVSDSYATAPGATIDSYQFTFTAGTYAVVSGALDSPIVTIDFDPCEQWGELVVIDTAGISKTRNFYIRVHDTDDPPDVFFDDPPLSGDLDRGWSLPIGAFAGVDAVLSNTFAVLWRHNELYGGETAQLYPDNNIAFVGWLQREDDTAQGTADYSVTEDARFEFTGVLPRMARLTAQLLGFTISNSPAIWGELSHLTPWRAICHFLSRYTTVANLCDVDFSSKDDTFLFAAISTQGGNVQSAVAGIAWQIDALLESAPDGRLAINRSAEFLSQAERDDLTVVANFIDDDGLKIVKSLEENASVGKLDGDGAVYNATNAQVTVFSSRAPGIAQGEAQGSDTLPAQILTSTTYAGAALDELRQRVGDKNVAVNNSETLTWDFPDGYAPIFIPSKGQLFTFTVDLLTANGVNRITYTTADKWMLERFQLNHQNKAGSTTNQGVFRRLLPPGSRGDDTTQVPDNSIVDPTPDLGLPAFDFELPALAFPDLGLTLGEINPLQLQPPPGQVVNLKGGTLIVKNAAQSFVLKNYLALTTPQSLEVTPSDLGLYEIEAVLFNPASPVTALGAYQLAFDGTNSAVWYGSNVAGLLPLSTKGADVFGEYAVLRATTAGVAIFGSNVAIPTAAIGSTNFVVTDNNYYAKPADEELAFGISGIGPTHIAGGVYTPGTGWVQTLFAPYGVQVIVIKAYFDAEYSFGGIDLHFTLSGSTGTYSMQATVASLDTVGVWHAGTQNFADWSANGNYTYHVTPNNGVSLIFGISEHTGNVSGSFKLTSIDMPGYTYVGPFDVGSRSTVRFSDDNGATFGDAVDLGDGIGIGGFDTQRSGSVSYGSITEAVLKASTLGGAYSAFAAFTGANPTCVIIPYYRRNSITVKQTSASDPDVLVGLDQADSDGGSLYFVDGATATKHNITPVAGAIFDNPNAVSIYYGKYIAATPKVSGVYKLYTSNDAGSTWTFRENLTTPHFVRGRRGDTSILQGYGQLYVTNGNSVDYSRKFGTGGTNTRNMPVTGIDGFDIAG